MFDVLSCVPLRCMQGTLVHAWLHRKGSKAMCSPAVREVLACQHLASASSQVSTSKVTSPCSYKTSKRWPHRSVEEPSQAVVLRAADLMSFNGIGR